MIDLPRGKTIVLKAEDKDYNRGLLVKLQEDGGYDVAYWYDDPSKIYPAEVKIDGKSITKDGKVVHIGYHPELKEDDPCWKGYKQVGMKKKNGKEVPNCVPMSEEELKEAGIDKSEVDYSHLEEGKKFYSHMKPNKKAIAYATKQVKALDTVINQMIKNKLPRDIWQKLQSVKHNLEDFIEDTSELVMGDK